MAFKEDGKKVWLNRSKSGKGVSIKVGNIFYVGAISQLKKWIDEESKREDGSYFGFSLTETEPSD